MVSLEDIHIEEGTAEWVVDILYNSYKQGHTLMLHYGDTQTGENLLHLHGIEGVVDIEPKQGRQVFNLKTNIGVVDLNESKIVGIRKDGQFIYKHPLYHIPTIELRDNGKLGFSIGVYDDRTLASNLNTEQAKRILNIINVQR